MALTPRLRLLFLAYVTIWQFKYFVKLLNISVDLVVNHHSSMVLGIGHVIRRFRVQIRRRLLSKVSKIIFWTSYFHQKVICRLRFGHPLYITSFFNIKLFFYLRNMIQVWCATLNENIPWRLWIFFIWIWLSISHLIQCGIYWNFEIYIDFSKVINAKKCQASLLGLCSFKTSYLLHLITDMSWHTVQSWTNSCSSLLVASLVGSVVVIRYGR